MGSRGGFWVYGLGIWDLRSPIPSAHPSHESRKCAASSVQRHNFGVNWVNSGLRTTDFGLYSPDPSACQLRRQFGLTRCCDVAAISTSSSGSAGTAKLAGTAQQSTGFIRFSTGTLQIRSKIAANTEIREAG